MPVSTCRAAMRLFAACLLLATTGAHAQSWKGGSGNNWSTGTNWFGGAAPANDGTAGLVFGPTGTTFTPNADTAWSLSAIDFSAIGYSIGGSTLTFPGDGTISVTGSGNSISNLLSISSSLTLDCAAEFTISGGATGPGELTKKGAATLVYTGTTWPTGTVFIGNGTLRIGNGATGPSAVGALVNNAHVAFDYLTDVSGPLSGSGAITIEAGAFVTNQSGAPFTHQGPTIIDGALNSALGYGASITNNASLVIGATGQLNTESGLVGSLAGSGFLNLVSGTFTAGGNNASTTFSGSFGGSGTFAKAGAGTLTFETGSWFSIPSTVNIAGGTLRVGTPTNWPNAVGGFVNNAHLVFGGGGFTEVAGPVSGTGAITINLGATVENFSGGGFTHQGTTTINGTFNSALGYGASITNNGRLVIGPSGQFFTESGTVGSLEGSGLLHLAFGTFSVGGDNSSTTFTGSFGGSGTLAKAGSGTLTLETGSWFSIPSTVNVTGGTLRVGTPTNWPNAVGGFVNDAHVVFGGGGFTEVAGPVSGTGAITINLGATVENFSGGGFSHQGTTTINGRFNSALGYGASITNNASLVIGPSGQFFTEGGTVGSLTGTGLLHLAFGTFSVGGDNSSTTFTGSFGGSGTLAKAGSGTLTLETGSWFSIPSTVNVAGGTLRVGTPTNWPNAVGGFVNDAHVVFGGSGFTEVAGPVSGNGAITIDAGSTVENFSGGGFAHQGTTTINGTFNSALGYGASITNNAALVIGPSGQFFTESGTVGSLAGAGLLNLAFGTFTAGGSNATTTFSGSFGGSGTFAKAGSGTLTLAGNSIGFSGSTTINAGTLSVTGIHGPITVGPGGTLKGTGSVGAVTVASGGTLAPGLSAGALATSGLTLNGMLSAEILGPTAGTQHDRVNVTGSVTINDATLALSGLYTPVAGDQLMLIANDGSDPVTGTFSGLPEGGTLTFNGRTLRITYTGGTGNDVVLSVAAYTVTPSAGANGSIAPNTPQSVAHGATTAFTVAPNAGYTASVSGTCGGNLVGTTYTTQAITADCTVVASFALNTYTVTPSAGPNGTIAPSTPQTVAHGSAISFVVTPEERFAFSVGGTCGGSLAGTTYTTNPITASCTVAVTFEYIDPPRLANISTRMQVLTGDDVLIGGFVIGGSSNKTVAIIATGPSLAAHGIPNPLANPRLRVVRSSDSTVVALNDDWQTASTASQLQGVGLAPAHPLEAAALVNLAPGAYTAIVQGAGDGTGVGVIAVYEVDSYTTPLINISARGRVQTGTDVMIGGFVIHGNGPQTVAIVGTGPSLAAYGIESPLANPTLTLIRSSDQAVLAINDDWQSGPSVAQLQAAGLAPVHPLESAILMTLPPGAYTTIMSGVGDGTGVGVIGVYRVN